MTRQAKRKNRSGNPAIRAAYGTQSGHGLRDTGAVDYIDEPLPDMPEPAPSQYLAGSRAQYAARVAALDALWEASAAVRTAQEDLGTAVSSARRLGLSWASVAETLGLDRETARRRFGDA